MFCKLIITVFCAILIFSPIPSESVKSKEKRTRRAIKRLNEIRVQDSWKAIKGIQIKVKERQLFTVDQIIEEEVNDENLDKKIDHYSRLLVCRYLQRFKCLQAIINEFLDSCHRHRVQLDKVKFASCLRTLYNSINESSGIVRMLNNMIKGLALMDKLPKRIVLQYAKIHFNTLSNFRKDLKMLNNISLPSDLVNENETVNSEECKNAYTIIKNVVDLIQFFTRPQVVNRGCVIEEPVMSFQSLSVKYDNLEDKTPYSDSLYVYISAEIGLFHESVIQDDYEKLCLEKLRWAIKDFGNEVFETSTEE